MSSSGGFLTDLAQIITDIPGDIIRLGANYQTTSLAQVCQSARVEPLTIISSDLIFVPEMTEISQTMLHLFIGYYLQAVTLTSGGGFVVKSLSRLNPDRHFDDFILTTEAFNDSNFLELNEVRGKMFIDSMSLCVEAYEYRLPISSNVIATQADVTRLSNLQLTLEASHKKAAKKVKKGDLHLALKKKTSTKLTKEDIKEALKSDDIYIRKMAEHTVKNHPELTKESFHDDVKDLNDEIHNTSYELSEKAGLIHSDYTAGIADKKFEVAALKELQNLGVGALVNVEFRPNVCTKDGKPVNGTIVPVNFRLSTASIPNSAINNLLCSKSINNTFVERYHAWRSGRISGIKDLILCQDLITEYRRALLKDKTGVLSEIQRRVKNGKLYGLISNNPSLVTASNIFIVSSTVALELESNLGGTLNKPRIREQLFEYTYAMFLVIVDTKYERVTIYTNGIASGTHVSYRDLKNANKSKGLDVSDLLKTFMAGSSPTF